MNGIQLKHPRVSKWVINFKWQLLFWVTVLHCTSQDMQETAVFKLSCCLWFLARDCRGSYITEPHLVLAYWEFIFPGIHVTLSAGSDSGLLQKVVSGKEGCCFQWPAWLADHTPSALKRAENETLQVSATVPACRGKKGKVKDMVVVTIPMDWLGRQKLGNRETIGHAHAEKQSQKGNGKAATWEKSSVGGGACFWHAEGQKGFLHMQRKGRKEKNTPRMSIFAMRVKHERRAHNKKKVQLIERGEEEALRLRVRRTDW